MSDRSRFRFSATAGMEFPAGVITAPATIFSPMRLHTYIRSVLTISCLLTCYPVCGNPGNRAGIEPAYRADTVPDISGLAWVEGDTFLAVHDAKNPEENNRPRVSLLRLPESLDGITWKPLALDWPLPQGASSDLESIARIPGTDSFLLVESCEGRADGKVFRRAFLIQLRDTQAVLLFFAQLPAVFKNIEGSAVVRLGDRLIFTCAERGDDRLSTEVYWTELRLDPLRFGTFNKAYFKPAGFAGENKRPVSAIEIDAAGQIYIASAYDPNDDNGPFTSVIWRAGRFRADRNNRVSPVFATKPYKLATLDGLKVESLAVRERKQGLIELFAGTDDENYGGALRPIPIGR